MKFLVNLLGGTLLVAALIALESLVETGEIISNDATFREKLRSRIKERYGIEAEDSKMLIFVDAMIDNTFQKINMIKTLFLINTGIKGINYLEDNLMEKLQTGKNKLIDTINAWNIPAKFSRAGAITKFTANLFKTKEDLLKKSSDYKFQQVVAGASFGLANNTKDISTFIDSDKFKNFKGDPGLELLYGIRNLQKETN